MKKKLQRIGVLSLAGLILTTSTGCMGSWGITTKIYNWNKEATGNKFVDNAIFWVFLILPVYQFSTFLDLIIFNVIEFWTGSNPLAMKAGETETQTVAYKGKSFKMTATKNRFKVENLSNGEILDLVYTENNKSWNMEQDGELTQLVQEIEGGSQVKLFMDGTETIVDNNETAFNEMKSRLDVSYAMK